MIFNTVADAAVRVVLDVVCGTQEAKHGLGWAAGERNVILYSDNGRIVGRDHEWVRDTLSVTVAMFQRMVLKMNIEKLKTIVCMPGYIWGK